MTRQCIACSVDVHGEGRELFRGRHNKRIKGQRLNWPGGFSGQIKRRSPAFKHHLLILFVIEPAGFISVRRVPCDTGPDRPFRTIHDTTFIAKLVCRLILALIGDQSMNLLFLQLRNIIHLPRKGFFFMSCFFKALLICNFKLVRGNPAGS